MNHSNIQEIVRLYEMAVEAQFAGNFTQEQLSFLSSLQDDPQAWYYFSEILHSSPSYNVRLVALQQLDKVVRYNWSNIPLSSRGQLRDYVITTLMAVIQKSPTDNLINLLNLLLVEIAKNEVPSYWSTFVSDLVESSAVSPLIAANSIKLFQLLCDDIFGEVGDEILKRGEKYQSLSAFISFHFKYFFESLLLPIISNSSSAELVTVVTDCISHSVPWCSHELLFQSTLLEDLILKALPISPMSSLLCFYQICNLPPLSISDYYSLRLTDAYIKLIEYLQSSISNVQSIPSLLNAANTQVMSFISIAVSVIIAYLKNYRIKLQTRSSATLTYSFQFLYHVTDSIDISNPLFKSLLEYWISLITIIKQQKSNLERRKATIAPSEADINEESYYKGVITQLRTICFNRMIPPEEVLIVETNYGQLRETVKNTELSLLYSLMCSLLTLILSLYQQDTLNHIYNELSGQLSGIDYSFTKLTSLSFCIGCLNQQLSQPEEKALIVNVVRDLLCLCEKKHTKEQKAVIASNIMYIVSSYSRFIVEYHTFLKTVIKKLFEFFHEPYPNVKIMSINTFQRIVDNSVCRTSLVSKQSTDSSDYPFIHYILDNLEETMKDLDREQTLIFIGSVAKAISAQKDLEESIKLIKKMFAVPDISSPWDWLTTQISQFGIDVLYKSETNIDLIYFIINMHYVILSNVGIPYLYLFSNIYVNLLEIYSIYSDFIKNSFVQHGNEIFSSNTAISITVEAVKKIRALLLRLFIRIISLNNGENSLWNENCFSIVNTFIYNEKFRLIFDNYISSPSHFKESLVLTLSSALIQNTKDNNTRYEILYFIFQIPGIFSSSYDLIITDSLDSDFLLEFYNLLLNVFSYCFAHLSSLAPSLLNSVIEVIIFGIKLLDYNISLKSLSILLYLLNHISKLSLAGTFYMNYYLKLLMTMFDLITDNLHTTQLVEHIEILLKLCNTLQRGEITINLFKREEGYSNNKEYVIYMLMTYLIEKFPNLNREKLEVILHGILSRSDNKQVRSLIDEFLIDVKQFNK